MLKSRWKKKSRVPYGHSPIFFLNLVIPVRQKMATHRASMRDARIQIAMRDARIDLLRNN